MAKRKKKWTPPPLSEVLGSLSPDRPPTMSIFAFHRELIECDVRAELARLDRLDRSFEQSEFYPRGLVNERK